jgi:hypothetical protein
MRSRMTLALMGLLVLVAAGCGGDGAEATLPHQGILAQLGEGYTLDDVMAQLPEGELSQGDAPRVVHGYRAGRYLAGGANIQVVWLHAQGTGGEFTDPRTELNPVIFRNDLIDGWGWEHFDMRAEEWGLPVPGEGEATGEPGTQT